MQFSPTLQLNRMLVRRNDHVVYDERFHRGVNIIRGENSSGKSTILNFIFYGLGGDLAEWSEIALRCSTVMLEVSFNANTATLRREVSERVGQPMDIFGGDIETALLAPHPEWARYPYRRSQSKESFSQAIFRLLGIPEVASEISGNVTVHQILRLIYADQLSPVESLFKFERFDPPTLREAVGHLLCGAYDNQIYQNELLLRDLNKEFESVNAELRSLFSVLGSSGENFTVDWIASERAVLEEKRNALREQIFLAEQEMFKSGAQDSLTLATQKEAYKSVQEIQEKIGNQRECIDGLVFTIADSANFIEGLQQKLDALSDANSVASYVVEVEFESCPACFTPVQKPETTAYCNLCKTPFDSRHVKERMVALMNETALQLKQSRSLQERRRGELEDAQTLLGSLEKDWSSRSQRLETVRGLPSGELQDAVRELYREAGYLEREIEDLDRSAGIAGMVDQLSRKKADLNGEMGRLRTDIEVRQAAQVKRKSVAYSLIADEVRQLLHSDLRRQDSFEDAKSIDFDFGADRISVDGQSYYSASSRVILKSSFFIGFLASAIKDPDFRYPRFCMIDTIEDKGMEPIRSHNFQNCIARISEEADVDHQIIFATAMIAPDLDEEQYTVGRNSTRDQPTLLVPD